MVLSKRQLQQIQLQQYLKNQLLNQDYIPQIQQQALEESSTEQKVETPNQTQSTPQEIDWNNVRLPDNHPLIKTLELYKSKSKELENKFKDIDPTKYREYSKLATEIEENRKKAEETALTEKQQWAALADRRVGEVEDRYKKELQSLQQQLEALTGERDQFKTNYESTQSTLVDYQKDRELRRLLSDNDFDFSDEDNYKLFVLDYGNQFEYDLEKRSLNAKSGSKKIDPNDLVKEIKQKKAKFWKGVTPSGSGSSTSTLTSVNSVTNANGSSGVIKVPKSMKNAPKAEWLKHKIDPTKVNAMIAEGSIIFEEA